MSGYKLEKKYIILFRLKIFFTFTNSVGRDEMQHYAAFHLGLHYLQKYFLNTKVNVNSNVGASVHHKSSDIF